MLIVKQLISLSMLILLLKPIQKYQFIQWTDKAIVVVFLINLQLVFGQFIMLKVAWLHKYFIQIIYIPFIINRYMIKNYWVLIFCGLLASLYQAKLGLLLQYDTTYTTATIKCFAESGMSNALYLTGYNGIIQQTINYDLMKIKNAGMGVDIVYMPCFGNNPQQEVQNFIEEVYPTLIDRVWIYLDSQQNLKCSWKPNDPITNIKVLKQFIDLFMNKFKVGLLTNKINWNDYTNGTAQFKNFPLFWMTYEPYKTAKFEPFSGWQKPTLKFFQLRQICGTLTDIYDQQ